MLKYKVMLRAIALNIARHLPAHVDVEDLISEGQFGLLDALERFDVMRGVRFEVFGARRIRGAIMDFVRSSSWAPRRVVQQARLLTGAQETLQLKFGRAPTEAELALQLGMTVSAYDALRVDVFRGQLMSGGQRPDDVDSETIIGGLLSPLTPPDELLIEEESRAKVWSLLGRLPAREAAVITQVYLEHRPLREIAASLGVTMGRVSQICKNAIGHLTALTRCAPREAQVAEALERRHHPRSIQERQTLIGDRQVALQQLAATLLDDGGSERAVLGKDALADLVNRGNTALLGAFDAWSGPPSVAFLDGAWPDVRDAMQARVGLLRGRSGRRRFGK